MQLFNNWKFVISLYSTFKSSYWHRVEFFCHPLVERELYDLLTASVAAFFVQLSRVSKHVRSIAQSFLFEKRSRRVYICTLIQPSRPVYASSRREKKRTKAKELKTDWRDMIQYYFHDVSRLWVLDVWRNTKDWLWRSPRICVLSRLVSRPLVYATVINEKGIEKENKTVIWRELFHSCKLFTCSKHTDDALCMCLSVEGGKVTEKTLASPSSREWRTRGKLSKEMMRTCVVYIPINIFHVIAWERKRTFSSPCIPFKEQGEDANTAKLACW